MYITIITLVLARCFHYWCFAITFNVDVAGPSELNYTKNFVTFHRLFEQLCVYSYLYKVSEFLPLVISFIVTSFPPLLRAKGMTKTIRQRRSVGGNGAG